MISGSNKQVIHFTGDSVICSSEHQNPHWKHRSGNFYLQNSHLSKEVSIF